MSLAVISDIHLKPDGGLEREVFEKFSSHHLVLDSQTIVFLGDIFDVLLGSYPQYLENYAFFFDFVVSALKRGQEVYYVEGNHDMHAQGLFCQSFQGIDSGRFYYLKGGFFKNVGSKRIYLSHGDDIDNEDRVYRTYRRFISSSFVKLLTESLVSFAFVESLCHREAANSRERNTEKYDSTSSALKESFRRHTEAAFTQLGFDILVCGHTHIKDRYCSESGFLYLNNGYAPAEKTFLLIREDGSEFVSL